TPREALTTEPQGMAAETIRGGEKLSFRFDWYLEFGICLGFGIWILGFPWIMVLGASISPFILHNLPPPPVLHFSSKKTPLPVSIKVRRCPLAGKTPGWRDGIRLMRE